MSTQLGVIGIYVWTGEPVKSQSALNLQCIEFEGGLKEGVLSVSVCVFVCVIIFLVFLRIVVKVPQKC